MIGSKGAQSSEQFMSRTGNHSTKPSAKGFSLLGGGEDPVALLSPAQKASNMKASLVAEQTLLQAELRELRRKLNFAAKNKSDWYSSLARSDEIKKRLGEILAIFTEMKPKKVPQNDLAQCFVRICKEKLVPSQFEAILAEAKIMASKLDAPEPNR